MEAVVTKLVIKTPNQRFEDLQIDCDLGWTVKKLKDYLSDVYPSKPSSIAQRLIYAGHLLQDHLQLNEVFNKENDLHTVHMVCAPTAEELGIHNSTPPTQKEKPKPTQAENPNASLPNQDGLRRRGTSCPGQSPMVQPTTLPGFNSPSQQQMTQWQQYMEQYWMSWQQQQQQQGQYGHFMQQCQYMMSMQQMYPGMNYNMFGGYPSMNPMTPMSPFSPLTPPHTPTPPVTPLSPNGSIHGQNVPQQVEPPPAQAQAQPARQNLRMNAQGGMFEDDDEEEEEGAHNRDWLDWIHTVMRAGVLISIMYFYSSTSRLLLVCVLGFIIYLYQGGWFNIRRNQAPQPAPQPAPQAQDVPREDEGNRREPNQNPGPHPNNQEAENSENTENTESENSNRIPTQRTNNQPGLLTVIYTFFTSLFTSLIPQGPAPLQQP